MLNTAKLNIQYLGVQAYADTLAAMQAYTQRRIQLKKNTKQGFDYDKLSDELWLVEHPSVYTLGVARKHEHLLQATDSAMVQSDRGGQTTWHGLGQLVGYMLFDLNALGWHVRDLVDYAERVICQTLNRFLNTRHLIAKPLKQAPGVYVFDKHMDDDALNMDNHLGKIASLGFKICHGFSYHGIAINLAANLTAFDAINPCGYAGLKMINLNDCFEDVPLSGQKVGIKALQKQLVHEAQLEFKTKPTKHTA